MEQVRFSAQPRHEAICPYCHDDLQPENEVVTCGGCGAPYHPDCLGGELSDCATLGCAVRPELGNRGTWAELNDRARRADLVDQALGTQPVREPGFDRVLPWIVVGAFLIVLNALRWWGAV